MRENSLQPRLCLAFLEFQAQFFKKFQHQYAYSRYAYSEIFQSEYSFKRCSELNARIRPNTSNRSGNEKLRLWETFTYVHIRRYFSPNILLYAAMK